MANAADGRPPRLPPGLRNGRFTRMDAHLFRRFCLDLTPLLTGARLEKIQEPAPELLALTFFSAGRKRQLCLRYGRKNPFCFLSSSRVSAGRAPSAPIMRLRKYAAGRRVAACVPLFWQRALWLLLGGGTGQTAESLTWLLLDMRQGPCLRFLPVGESPEEERPLWPEPGQLVRARENWRDWPVLTPALRRTLACLDEPEQWALLEDLRQGGGDVFCYSLSAPVDEACKTVPGEICAVSAWPLPPQLRRGLKTAPEQDVLEESGPDVLALTERAGQDLVLGRLAHEQAREAALPLDRRGRKLTRLLDKLRDEEDRLTAMLAARGDALALQEHLWRWPADLRASSVSIPQGEHGPVRDIALDPRHTVRQEMERLFHTARRGSRGLEHLRARRAALEEEMAALTHARRQSLLSGPGHAADAFGDKNGADRLSRTGGALPASLPGNVQLFVSEDGFTLLRGRDSRGNLAARKLAAPHDIWLHAENGPGSHVIIRRSHGGQSVPERTLDQAGALAACKSWQRDAARARIQYAEVRHVKPMRDAPAGTVRVDKVLASREVDVDAALEEKLLPR